VTNTKRINIENELAILMNKFDSQRNILPRESIFLFESLFSLFRVLIAAIGVKATSRNSSLPPSQDPFRQKDKSKDKKKVGGQEGHKGKSLKQVLCPDKVIYHAVDICTSCDRRLSTAKCHHISKHQVFDIEVKVVVTEHQAEHKVCECGHMQSAQLPSGVSAPCQFGASVKSMAVDLTNVQFVPQKRASDFFASKLNLSVSQRSIENFNKECFEKLAPWEEAAKLDLIKSELMHGDETGININKVNAWIHSLSNDRTVLMMPHMSRGSEAIDAMGILPHYHSILCHDFWAPYSAYDVIHACCHAHLQRELIKADEDYSQKWALKFKKLFLYANKLRNKQDGILTWDQIRRIESTYSSVLKEADIECPLNINRNGKRGRIGQSYPRQLLNRLIMRRSWILLFLYDSRVPFTNNQAERDIRMTKVQQKVSGCFRTFEGAQRFCRIRSFILSMQKQGKNPQEELEKIFRGT
jgi:transposase